MRRRARRVDWLLVVASSLLTLVSLELGFRAVARWRWLWDSPRDGRDFRRFEDLARLSDDPGLGIELKPRLDARFRGKEFRTNSLGFRGPEFGPKKAGVLRIAGIGDSVMMGWGVAQDETYLARLEGELRARGKAVETLNFAVSGYNTEQELHMLRDRALDFEPDLIVLGYVGNDFEPPNFRVPRVRFSSPSYLLNFCVLRSLLWTGALPAREAYDWRPAPKSRGPSPRGFREALAGIAELAARRKLPLVVLLDSRYQSPLMSHRRVAELARGLGAETLDLRKLYRRLPDDLTIEKEVSCLDEHNRLYKIPGDTHLNALWHERVARTLAGFLVAKGLVK